jgi:hypothetical protein
LIAGFITVYDFTIPDFFRTIEVIQIEFEHSCYRVLFLQFPLHVQAAATPVQMAQNDHPKRV